MLHHLGPRRYARGADDGRRPACAQHRLAQPALVSVDGRRPERPGLLLRSRPDAARARHGRYRHVADARAARHDQPRLRRARALRRRQDPRRRRRSSTRDARVVDLNGATPQVSATAPMAYGRRQHNLTVLADGTVLATGGNSSGAGLVDLNAGVYPAEQWNPATGQWRTWPRCRSRASTTRPRCCCPTGASSPPAEGSAARATRSATSPRTPRSSRRPTSSRPTARLRRARSSTAHRRPRATAPPMEIATGEPGVDPQGRPRPARRALRTPNDMEQRYIPLSFTAGATSLTASAPARCQRRAAGLATCSSSSTPTACLPLPAWSASRATRRRPSRSRSRRTARPSPRPPP